MQVKTDLIIETANILEKQQKGYTLDTKKLQNGLTKTIVQVVDKEGSKFLQKEEGYYITLDAVKQNLFYEKVKIDVEEQLKNILLELTDTLNLKTPSNFFIVGLGNKEMVSDSLGPKVVEKILVTRHMKELVNSEKTRSINSVSAISTGVLGTTGIETAHIIKALVKEVKPDLVIIVDTLSTKETSRIASSFQLTTAGIVPGGGVGNKRESISAKSLGVPVIVIGVPLVVYAYSMCKEVLEVVSDKIKPLEKYEEKLSQIASNILGDLVVTIKDIDKVVENCADIISSAINLMVNPNISKEDFKNLMNEKQP